MAYVLVKKKKRKTLQSHAVKCIFVGYTPGKKAWTFYNPHTQKFIESSHATSDERVFSGNTKTLVKPFGDLSTPTSAPPLILTSASKHILDTSDLHHQGGVLDYDSTASDNPLPPQLPAIDTPFGSPLSSIPSLPSSAPSSWSPSPAPARSPIHAPLEPKFGKDGLMIPEPNTGCGQQLHPNPSGPQLAQKRPWNYCGKWPPPQPETSTTSEQPSVEPPNNSIPVPNEDDPVILDPGSSSHLSNEQILAGMSYVDCGDDPELGYLTLSEAVEVAFKCHIEHAFATSSHENEPCTLAEALA